MSEPDSGVPRDLPRRGARAPRPDRRHAAGARERQRRGGRGRLAVPRHPHDQGRRGHGRARTRSARLAHVDGGPARRRAPARRAAAELDRAAAARLRRAAPARRRATASRTAALIAELTAAQASPATARRSSRTSRSPAPPRRRRGERRSIRVPAEKIDTLLDLVGETVLHRRRLEHELGATPATAGTARRRRARRRRAPARRPQGRGDRHADAAAVVDRHAAPARRARPRRRDRQAGRARRRRAPRPSSTAPSSKASPSRSSTCCATRSPTGSSRPRSASGVGKPARGRLELRAEQRGSMVEVTVADDGRGVSEETLAEARRTGSLTEVLTQPGFSTADEVSGIAGRGVGLDAVKEQVEAFGGSIEVRSEPGRGTQVILRLPLALALIEVLLVERGRQRLRLPARERRGGALARRDAVARRAGRRSSCAAARSRSPISRS